MGNNTTKKRRKKSCGTSQKKVAVFAQPKANKLLIRKTTSTKKCGPTKELITFLYRQSSKSSGGVKLERSGVQLRAEPTSSDKQSID